LGYRWLRPRRAGGRNANTLALHDAALLSIHLVYSTPTTNGLAADFNLRQSQDSRCQLGPDLAMTLKAFL
jgi:hypothetical protein